MTKKEFEKLLIQKGYKLLNDTWCKWNIIIKINRVTYTKFIQFESGFISQIESPYFSQHRSL
jgi:hypothetical protein